MSVTIFMVIFIKDFIYNFKSVMNIWLTFVYFFITYLAYHILIYPSNRLVLTFVLISSLVFLHDSKAGGLGFGLFLGLQEADREHGDLGVLAPPVLLDSL